MDWKKLLLAAGGAASAAAVLYYLLKEESEAKRSGDDSHKGKEQKKKKVDEFTKEQVQQVLQEIIQSQDKMKNYMKDLTQELLTKQLTFEQTYKKVKEVQPNDPLEKYGLSMMDFDELLDRHQSDPGVREAIHKIMGAPNASSTATDKVKAITVKKILDVHQYMLEELEGIVDNFQKIENKNSYDMKTVTIAAQAVVGSKVEAKFGITSEDIESAVLMYHTVLATDQEFANINVRIQRAMGKLMGTGFAPA